jgi:23S rRNA pseudouridine2457 synthase
MNTLLLFNKPYGVLSQFTDPECGDRGTLSDYLEAPGYRPAGRLDFDSEGLLILTNNGKIQSQIAHPKHKMTKVYWAQVEGEPDEASLMRFERGLILKDGPTLPAKARRIEEPPKLWSREPPIRVRAKIPTAWLEIELSEGRNRQVRRMTAAIGFPTLRLIRYAIGAWSLGALLPGESQVVDAPTMQQYGARKWSGERGRDRRSQR